MLPTDLFFILGFNQSIIGKPGQGNYNIGNTACKSSRGTPLEPHDPEPHALMLVSLPERTDNLLRDPFEPRSRTKLFRRTSSILCPIISILKPQCLPQTVMGETGTCEQFLVDNYQNLPSYLIPIHHLWRLGGSGGHKSNNPNSAKLSIKKSPDEARKTDSR